MYPFPNPKPLGWGMFETLTSGEMTQVNANAAAAADGGMWSDIAVIKGWKHVLMSSLLTTIARQAVCYDRISKRWIVIGAAAGVTGPAFTTTGTQWYTDTIGTTKAAFCAASNPSGLVLVGTDEGGGATAQKIFETTDGGENWTPRSIGASDTNDVFSIAYVQSLSLWVASVFNTGIFTSPDGSAWTSRGGPGGMLTVRENPTRIIAHGGPGFPPGNAYRYSDDAINWTAQTFPADISVDRRGIWSDVHGKFYLVSGTGVGSGIYTSTTGLTGSWSLIDSFNSSGLAQFGRAIIRGDGKASIDGGSTWTRVLELAAGVNSVEFFGEPGVGVVGVRSLSTDVFTSTQVGF